MEYEHTARVYKESDSEKHASNRRKNKESLSLSIFNSNTKTISCTNTPSVLQKIDAAEAGKAADSGKLDLSSCVNVCEIGSEANSAPKTNRQANNGDEPVGGQNKANEKFGVKNDTFVSSDRGMGGETEIIWGDDADESGLSRADDSGSVSSLMLDGTMMLLNDTEFSLLDDPFIALGASGDRDSLNEDAAEASEPEPLTSSDVMSAMAKRDPIVSSEKDGVSVE